MKIGPGTLKLVASTQHALRQQIEDALQSQAGPANVRCLAGDVFLLHTEATTEAVRGWLSPLLADDESLLVVEFERWSSYGQGVDRDWLRERGH